MPCRDFDHWPRPTLARRVYALARKAAHRQRDRAALPRRARTTCSVCRARALALRATRAATSTRGRCTRVVDGLARFTLGAERRATSLRLRSRGTCDPLARRSCDLACAVQASADARDSLRATAAICAVLDAAARRRRAAPLTYRWPTGLPPFDGPRAGRADADADPPTAKVPTAMPATAAGAQRWPSASTLRTQAPRASTRAARAPRRRPPQPPPRTATSTTSGTASPGATCPTGARSASSACVATTCDFLHELRERHAALRSEVRRQFAAIRPAFRQRVHRRLDGDEVDIDARHRGSASNAAPGRLAEGRVFIAAQQPRRDVCAAFLVDMSGSTGFLVPDPQPRGAGRRATTMTTMTTSTRAGPPRPPRSAPHGGA